MTGKWMRAGAVAAFALLTTGAEAQSSLGTAYGMTQQALVQTNVTLDVPHSQTQVAALFEDSFDRVLPLWKVDRPVRLDVTILRFPEAWRARGAQLITFRIEPVDPYTGRRLAMGRVVKMKLPDDQSLSSDRRAMVGWIAARLEKELGGIRTRL